jgi:hypothetical protein
MDATVSVVSRQQCANGDLDLVVKRLPSDAEAFGGVQFVAASSRIEREMT